MVYIESVCCIKYLILAIINVKKLLVLALFYCKLFFHILQSNLERNVLEELSGKSDEEVNALMVRIQNIFLWYRYLIDTDFFRFFKLSTVIKLVAFVCKLYLLVIICFNFSRYVHLL